MKAIKFMVLVLFTVSLNAGLIDDYLNKKYTKICSFENIKKYKNNEKALSIVGVSCIKTDSLYMLPYIINILKHTSYGRTNSIYFLTILMQKKLLYSYLSDNFSLKSFSFPMTDYVLSYIFDAIKHNDFKKEDGIIIIQNKKNNVTYHVYKQGDKMFVDEYKESKLIKRRWYR